MMHCMHLSFEAVEAVVDVLKLGLRLTKFFILSRLKGLVMFMDVLSDDEVTSCVMYGP